jgi:hypothetical protein
MFPPAIIFINGNTDGYGYTYGDLDGYGKETIESQLYIHETMTGDEFDARVAADPNYPDIVHSFGFRILVIRPDLRDYTNRELADIVLFVKGGMVSVEKNNFGPPGLTLSLERLEIHQLLRYNNSKYVAILPQTIRYPYPRTLAGIFAIQASDTSGVHDPNTDNEYNNPDFINRK